MKVLKGVLIIVLIAISMIAFLPRSISNATTIKDISERFEANTNNNVSYDSLKDVIGKVLGFLQLATGLISIIIIAATGYNYIIAPTPDLKGEVKRKMLPLVLGTVLVFCAISIANFITKAIE